jgi:two-component system response regulator FlrC
MTNPAVLIVEDDANLREALFDTLNSDALPVLTADSGPAALEILDEEIVGLVISDLQMEPMDGAALLQAIRQQHPSLPAVLMTAHGTIENAVDAIRNGAADYLVKPFAAEDLKAVVARYMRTADLSDRPVAVDPASRELLRIAERVAATEATVTISGESGSGKEVIARFIHARSARRDRPFVAINCAAIPENMLEAVLFGYEKGAFTGASTAHAGKFEQAQHGTLLLDEISEMDLGLQAKLLRVLQEREVERLGGRAPLALDVRVLATTNRDLRQQVAAGRFREDLYYRLNVFPLHIPPLRERSEDILPLARMIVARHHGAAQGIVEFSAAAERALLGHDWPGNVRELENLLQRTLILLPGSRIGAADLAFETDGRNEAVVAAGGDLQHGLRDREQQLILDALQAHNGQRNAVAGALGISARTLRYKLARMREQGIPIPAASGDSAAAAASQGVSQ